MERPTIVRESASGRVPARFPVAAGDLTTTKAATIAHVSRAAGATGEIDAVTRVIVEPLSVQRCLRLRSDWIGNEDDVPMRIALVGWDLDDGIAAELARLGAEVVGITRWVPEQHAYEVREGWTKLRCAHMIGGTSRDEAGAFGVAVIRDASTLGIDFEFDVIHAVDRLARAAAGELAARAPGSVLLASLRAVEEGSESGDGFGRQGGAHGWICDHPWVAECLRARLRDQVPVRVVPTPAALGMILAREQDAERAPTEPFTSLVVTLSHAARVSPGVLIAAVKRARETIEGLNVSVFGTGPRAEILRRRVQRRGFLAERWAASTVPSLAGWNTAIAQATVIGVDVRALSEDPVAQLAWLAGRPVVRLAAADPESLARALCDAIHDPTRRDRDVASAAALGRRNLEPPAIAAAWLRVYLDALASPRQPEGRMRGRSSRPLAFPELRSRLTLTPLSAHEVLASWSLRPDDWNAALEWLGPDAVRAVLTVRIFDVTDLIFNGMNAHSVWDVDLRYGELHRKIDVRFDGRSLAGCLGLRTQWGYFHPIAHGRLCHLPREGLAPVLPPRWLRVMPRRNSP